MNIRAAALAMAQFYVIGCSTVHTTTLPPLAPTVRPTRFALAQSKLNSEIARYGGAVFRTWNGVYMGYDCDVDICFLPGGKARVIVYGLGVDDYSGTYQIDAMNRITIKLDAFEKPWPPIMLLWDESVLVLYRADTNQWKYIWNPGGDRPINIPNDWWPLRHVPLDKRGRRMLEAQKVED